MAFTLFYADDKTFGQDCQEVSANFFLIFITILSDLYIPFRVYLDCSFFHRIRIRGI